ncbi:MAG: type II toxin-antitoxin system YafQ family toxin [Bacteroidetes bacterium]|nr:type II toxin-antitoxin system YafQ family toxin [Bacteroidota bacterium]
MYSFIFTNQFKKDFELLKKRNYDTMLLNKVFLHLQEIGTVPESYKPHKLQGKFSKCLECHIKPDWLLIWKTDKRNSEIILVRTGTHSDLFV